MKVVSLAMIAHQINCAYSKAIGEESGIVAWEDLPESQRQSIKMGVEMRLANPKSTPEGQHASWLAAKEADGWVYGEVKDFEAKTHPYMKPYSELSAEQRVKDSLFAAVIDTLKNQPDSESYLEVTGDLVKARAENDLLRKAVKNSQPTLDTFDHRRVTGTTVKYTGNKQFYTDVLYGSGLTFTQGQMRTIPSDLAEKFTRHPEFEATKLGEHDADLDTKTILDRIDEAKVNETLLQEQLHDEIDNINRMSKADLLVYAQSRYEISIPKNRTLPDLRKEVTELVHRFGVVGA